MSNPMRINMERTSKFSLSSILIAIALVFVLFSFAACSDDLSTDDGGNTSQRTIYYVATGLSDYTSRALKSVPHAKSDGHSVPDIFVIEGKETFLLSPEELQLLLRTVAEGKTVLIDAPSEKMVNFAALVDMLLLTNLAINWQVERRPMGFRILMQDILNVYRESSILPSFEAVAVRGSEIYYVHDIQDVTELEDADGSDGETSQGSKSEDAIDEEDSIIDQSRYVTPVIDFSALTEVSAANFADWLNNADSPRSLDRAAFDRVNASRAARSALEDALPPQTFHHNFTAIFSHSYREHYDGRYDGRCENVEVITDVWTACEFDSKTEYYLVRNSIVCNNQELKWTDDWDKGYYVPPYFDTCWVHTKIDGTTARPNDCSPQTATGSTNFTSETTLSLTGNVGLSLRGPKAGVGGGMSWKKSSTRSIPDIDITFSPESNAGKAAWKFDTPSLRGHADNFGSDITFDKPKDIQIRAAVFDTYSLFSKPTDENDTSQTTKVETRAVVRIGMKTAWKKKHKIAGVTVSADCIWKGLWRDNKKTFTDTIQKPCNVKRQYIMGFERPEGISAADADRLYAIVGEYISDWNNVTDYYAVGINSLDTVARKSFNAAMLTIKTNQNVFHDRGFSGTFKFYIQNTESAEKIATQEFTF
ncbi:MAG: hypothetical protein IJ257_01070 [Treponema sp.]|nr:hypothetical protein [Treponema sp.]